MAEVVSVRNGHSVGGRVDRSTVARRIEARATPLGTITPTRPRAAPPTASPVPADDAAWTAPTAVARALVTTDVDLSGVERARRPGMGTLAFVAAAVVDALRAFPAVNASITPAGVHHHGRIDLRVAVPHGDGLVATVVEGAEDLLPRALAERLSARAPEAGGGTFTLVDLGAFGAGVATPAIEPPQVAALAVGGVRSRAVAIDIGSEWAWATRPMASLSLSFDHRAFDGAYAAAFLARVREGLEEQRWEEDH